MDKAQEVARKIHDMFLNGKHASINECHTCNTVSAILRDHGVGSEQGAAGADSRKWFYSLPDHEVTEMDAEAGRQAQANREDGSTAMGFIIADRFTADIRRQLAEREAVIEKVRTNKAIYDLAEREESVAEIMNEVEVIPSTILSAHDAEVRRETINKFSTTLINKGV